MCFSFEDNTTYSVVVKEVGTYDEATKVADAIGALADFSVEVVKDVK